jgi:hypothetical protein
VAASSALTCRTVSPSALLVDWPVAPKAPKSTFASERFIALHMIWLRMIPLEPTRAPEMMRTSFLITNPVIAPAIPE